MTLNGLEFKAIENLRCGHLLTEEQTFAMKTIFIVILVHLCSWLVYYYFIFYAKPTHSCDVRFTITIVLLKIAIFGND